MLFKCKHGVLSADKQKCEQCNKRPVTLKPGQSIGR